MLLWQLYSKAHAITQEGFFFSLWKFLEFMLHKFILEHIFSQFKYSVSFPPFILSFFYSIFLECLLVLVSFLLFCLFSPFAFFSSHLFSRSAWIAVEKNVFLFMKTLFQCWIIPYLYFLILSNLESILHYFNHIFVYAFTPILSLSLSYPLGKL